MYKWRPNCIQLYLNTKNKNKKPYKNKNKNKYHTGK